VLQKLTLTAILTLTGTMIAADPVTPAWTGFRGAEGSGVWPTAKPPSIWDGATGQNIRWKAPLANWGLGQPVVVKGKVIVMSDPGWKHDWPLLQCFDTATGKLAWGKELNSFDIYPDLPAAEKTELKTILSGYHEFNRKWYTAHFEFGLQTPEGRTQGMKLLAELGLLPVDAQVPNTFAEAMKLPGYGEKAEAAGKQWGKLAKIGWRAESWHTAGYASGLDCIGYTFPTPVTDGERIYIATGYDTFWCFDLDGKMIWGTPSPGSTVGDFCPRGKSPILYKNLMISDLGDRIRFIDKTNGKVLFMAQTTKGGYGLYTSPVIIRVADTDIVLCAGRDDLGGLSEIFAFRLPDGKALSVKGWSNPGGSMLVKYDAKDTVFFIGGGEHGGWEKKGEGEVVPPPAAVKFALADDTLHATVLWSGLMDSSYGTRRVRSHSGILYHDGKFYVCGVILDAVNGKRLGGEFGNGVEKASARGNHMQIANGLIYALDKDGDVFTDGKMEVFSLDGKPMAINKISSAKVEGEKRDQIRAQVKVNKDANKGVVAWGNFSYSCPFMIHDDTIFIRGNDELWCIANEAIASPLDDPALVASIVAAKDLPTLTPHLTAARPRYRREALLRLAVIKPSLPESVSKTITDMITQDLYQEVRAAAILALDACDPAGLAGWRVFVANCIAADKQTPWSNAMATARALGGKAMTPHIQRDLAIADPTTLFALISVANEAGLVMPSLVDRALDLMQTAPKERHNRLMLTAALYLVDTAKADPRSLPAVRQAKTITAEQIIRLLEWRLPVAEFPAFLEEQIRPGANLGENPNATASGLVANMIRRMEKAQAIPLLEKLGVARPDIKDRLSAIAKSLP